MKIAIVSSNKKSVETVRLVLSGVSGYTVLWDADVGTEAVRKCFEDKPDLALIDIDAKANGKDVDGIDITKIIMEDAPCATLVMGADVKSDTSRVFSAMGFGALDAVSAPVEVKKGQIDGADKFLAKINTIGKLLGKMVMGNGKAGFKRHKPEPAKLTTPLIIIGASTGGPSALASILSILPADLNAAIVIIQHVDEQFTPGFKTWLNDITPLDVCLVSDGDFPETGKVFIAGTNDHLILHSNFTFGYTPNPIDYPYRPSVDVFFNSVAKCRTGNGVAALLTGMGKDGAKGLLELRKLGWHTIAQDQKSSVLFGMPKEAAKIGAAVDVLPLDEIAPKLLELISDNGRVA